MMYFLYVLRSLKDDKLYVGVTKDVHARLKQHNEGLTPSTRHRRPLVLIHVEAFESKCVALKREKHLKSLAGSAEKKIIAAKCELKLQAPVAQLDRATDF
jgi:putative endonuclease